MNLVNGVLIGTCAIVFVVSAAITILSITNVIKIDREYQSKLFYILIVEVVITGVLVFKNSLNPEAINIVRITSESPSFKKDSDIYVWGFCQKQPNVSFKGFIQANSHKYPLGEFKLDDRNLFQATTVIDDSVPKKIEIFAYLIYDSKIIVSDSVEVLTK